MASLLDEIAENYTPPERVQEPVAEQPSFESPRSKFEAIIKDNLGVKGEFEKPIILSVGGGNEVQAKIVQDKIILTDLSNSDLGIEINIREKDGNLVLQPNKTGKNWFNEEETDKTKNATMGRFNAAAQKIMLGAQTGWESAKENGGLSSEKIGKMLSGKNGQVANISVSSDGLDAEVQSKFYANMETRMVLEKSSLVKEQGDDLDGLVKASLVGKEGAIEALKEAQREATAHVGANVIADIINGNEPPSLLDEIVAENRIGRETRIQPSSEPVARQESKGVEIPDDLLALLPALKGMKNMGITGGDSVNSDRQPLNERSAPAPTLAEASRGIENLQVSSVSGVSGAAAPGVKQVQSPSGQSR